MRFSALVFAVVAATLACPAAGGKPSLKPGWPVATGDAVMSSPCLADLNGDRRPEVVVGSFDGKVYVLDSAGKPLPGWPKATGGPVISSPAVGDLRGDGRMCIVAGSQDGKIYAWHASGRILPGWPQRTGGKVFSSPALAYLENSSQLAVVVGSDDGKVYAFRADGTMLPGWPVDLGAPIRCSPAVGDMDRDGRPEIAVTSEGKKLYVLSASGRVAPGWPRTLGSFNNGSPSMADVDNDGRLEVFANGNNYYFYAYRVDGSNYGAGDYWMGSNLGASSPVFADVHGDGKLEMGLLSVIPPETATISFYKSDGTAVDGFPVTVRGQQVDYGLSGSLAVGDIDGDNQLDAVAGIGDRLYAWRLGKSYSASSGTLRHAGEPVEGFPIRLGGEVLSTPALGDLDSDGRLDLVVGASDGRIYCYDLGIGTCNPDALPWPMFRGNRMHTAAPIPTSVDSGNLLASHIKRAVGGRGRSGEHQLKSASLQATIDASTGSLVDLRSSEMPDRPVVDSPPGLVVYLWDKLSDRVSIFSRCTKLQKVSGTSGKDREPWVAGLRCELAPGEGSPALGKAVVTYGMLPDNLEIQVELTGAQESDAPVELGVALGMDMSRWVRQMYGNGSGVSTYRATKRVVARYYDYELDMTTGGAGTPMSLAFPPGHHAEAEDLATMGDSPMFSTNMPMVVFESKDAFLLWGYKDVNSYTFFTPSHVVSGPGFTVTPRNMRAGAKYRFNFFVKPFAKPEASLTDIGYWYAQNIYSTNPLTRDLVGLPKGYHEHRTMLYGNVTFHPGPKHFAKQRNAEAFGITDELLEKFETRAAENAMTLLWWSGASDWAELFPTTGEWVNDFGFHSTPDDVRTEIARLKSKGLHPYRYFRQIYNLLFDNQPPYIDWAMSCRHGWPFNYTYGPRGDLLALKGQISPEQRWLHGFDPAHLWGPRNIHADFCSPEFIEWYEKMTKNWLDTFDVCGIAWDMGWDSHVSPCTANSPDTPVRHSAPGGTETHMGPQHGILRAMADIYLWAKRQHPEMKFLMNGSQNSPIMRYVDGVLFEGGWTANKDGIDFCKFYGVPMTNLSYSSQYPDQAAQREAAMRLLSYGVTHANSFVSPEDNEMTEFYHFSAKANSVPLAWEDGAIRFEWSPEEQADNEKAELLNMEREYPTSAPLHVPPPGRLVTGSVWADASHLLVAIYNHKEHPVQVRASLSGDLLARYGWKSKQSIRLTVLGPDGLPAGNGGFRQDGHLVTGALLPGQLLLGIEDESRS